MILSDRSAKPQSFLPQMAQTNADKVGQRVPACQSDVSVFRICRTSRAVPHSGFCNSQFCNLCSPIRSTRQTARRNACFTRRSRVLLPSSFRCQNARLFFGFVACRGQPCQKQPSIKMANRATAGRRRRNADAAKLSVWPCRGSNTSGCGKPSPGNPQSHAAIIQASPLRHRPAPRRKRLSKKVVGLV